jgi:hypothetical protein
MLLVLYNSNPRQVEEYVSVSGYKLMRQQEWDKLKDEVEHIFWLFLGLTKDPLEFITESGETIEYYSYEQWLEDYVVYPSFTGNTWELYPFGSEFFHPDVCVDEPLREV